MTVLPHPGLRDPERLASVARYRTAAPIGDAGLSALTAAAASMLRMPMAWVMLVEASGAWLLAATGAAPGPDDFGDDLPFCGVAIRRPGEPLLVADARLDERFSNSAIVRGRLAVRAYAGMPLLGREGLPLGTLCVLGVEPHRFSRTEQDTLAGLAAAANGILEALRCNDEKRVRRASPGDHDRFAPLVQWRCDAAGMISHVDPRTAAADPALPVLSADTDWISLAHSSQQDEIRRRWQLAVLRREPLDVEFRARDREACICWLQVRLQPPAVADEPWCGTLQIVDRVSARWPGLRDPAALDPVTGLVDIRHFHASFDRIALDTRFGVPCAFFFLDVDDFKLVTNTLGHEAGNLLLREVARRLVLSTAPTDLVARLSGDEFLIAQTRLDGPADAARQADRIIAALRQPFSFEEHAIEVGASIGISLGPRDGDSAMLLQRHADLALHRAKQDGEGVARFFDPTMDARATNRRRLTRDIRHALGRGEFFLDYQPILSLRRNRVTTLEALLRWRHPQRGLVTPSEFIPLIEGAGLMMPIYGWVLRQACRTASTWPDDLSVAVNLSPHQITAGDFVDGIPALLAETGLAPERLELEITETLPLIDNAHSLLTMQRLRALGVRIVLDDFGTGYSSLAYLSSFTFDKIKLDRSLVAAMAIPKGLSIARAIIRLANDFGTPITAEGIETDQQFQQVVAEGCAEAQGFRIARPMAPARLADAIALVDARYGEKLAVG